MIEINIATSDDLDFLEAIEKESFPEERRFSKASLQRAIKSKAQNVYILKKDNINVASAIIHIHKSSIRLYSIAVLTKYRQASVGRVLMEYIINDAKDKEIEKITLEADFNQNKLVSWYESFGFKSVKVIPDYYGINEPALKMELIINPTIKRTTNLVVVDKDIPWLSLIPNIEVISAEKFINEKRYQTGEFRVFNLCQAYTYQSLGYYVSLLASARELRAIPNAVTIEDFIDSEIVASIGDEASEIIRKSLKNIKEQEFTLNVYFGKTSEIKYRNLARILYKLFPSPLLEFSFIKKKGWKLNNVRALSVDEVEVGDEILSYAKDYFTQRRFTEPHFKNYKYDLAILVDEADPSPPSCKASLSKFKYAAEKIGFYTEFITKEDYHRINQFDALFIRTTTNVNDYTYQFSRLAYSEGLIVIDDPWSILKCANKLYLHESMNTHNILTPKTIFVTKRTDLNELIAKIGFPVVLKQPDSAASRGVIKALNIDELKLGLESLFLTSEIILAQEYLKTDFDWRVGILDNKPLFVSKYYMAKGHWQIYNWDKKQVKFTTGRAVTISVNDAPKKVLEAALKAARIMGDGFYGVDLKEVNNEVYVIEVNDNPSVDTDWEDQVLKDELYMIIMKHIYDKIEAARNIKKRSSLPRIN